MAFLSLWRKGVTHAGDQLLSGSGILGLLIRPQLQSFVFKGLDITAWEVEEGAEQAVKMVYAHRNTGDADAPRLLSLCEPRLCSKMAAADCAEWPRPALQRIDGVTLETIKFAWADDKPGHVTIKPVSTILVGATPEFEVAALSLAFLCGECLYINVKLKVHAIANRK